MEVNTNGAITAEDAMRQGTDILMKHLALLSTKGLNFEVASEYNEEEMMDDATLRVRKLLQTPITSLNLSVRSTNCLKDAKITILGELAKHSSKEMSKFRNLGKKSLEELENLMDEYGLEFGMDISQYRLDEDII